MKSRELPVFELPKKLEGLLATLVKLLQKRGNESHAKVIVNATCEVVEAVDYDNWDGGQYGHLLRLKLDDSVFFEVMDAKEDIQNRIQSELNGLADSPGEYFCNVSLSLLVHETGDDWRANTGLLTSTKPKLATATEPDLHRLWGTGHLLRVFISHKAEHKALAQEFSKELADFGLCGFVAHESIEPTRTWQDEIERALGTMDLMVLLLTKSFKESPWTNQEIGVALGRGVLVVPIRLGEDPSGFASKIQALSGQADKPADLVQRLLALLTNHPQFKDRLAPAFTQAWEKSASFNQTTKLLKIFEQLKTFPAPLLERLEEAFRTNKQLSGLNGGASRFRTVVAHLRAAS